MGRRSIALRRAGGAALAIAVVALVWLLLAGGGDPEGGGETSASTAAEGTPREAGSPVDALSTEELVDQVLLVGFDGSDPDAKVIRKLEDHQVGGVLIAPSNWDGADAGAKLIEAVRRGASRGDRIAPLIATAQEGGFYRALGDLPPDEREIEIGDRNDPKLAERWGEQGAKALAEVGVDLNLAPVADVATLDSPIADRAFSDDATVAAEMTAAAVRGCEQGGVACAVSHFPGLGAASQDTNQGPAIVGLDPAMLRARDLLPFEAAFDAGAPAVVVSNGLYAAFDSVTPASLLPEITTGLLRDEVGFKGVAISDDIGAGAITAVIRTEEAAVQAVGAGIDLVQVAEPDDVAPVRRALLAAVDDGTLSEDRLREAAGRVLALKRSLEKQGEGGKKDEGKKRKAGPAEQGGGPQGPVEEAARGAAGVAGAVP